MTVGYWPDGDLAGPEMSRAELVLPVDCELLGR